MFSASSRSCCVLMPSPSPKPAHQTAAVRRAEPQPLGIATTQLDRSCLETKHSLKIPLLWSYGAMEQLLQA